MCMFIEALASASVSASIKPELSAVYQHNATVFLRVAVLANSPQGQTVQYSEKLNPPPKNQELHLRLYGPHLAC